MLPLALAGCGSGAGELPVVEDLTCLLERSEDRPIVLVFVAVDCPISNYFAPELERIHQAYAGRGVEFYLVYWDPSTSSEEARAHQESFGYTMPALFDFERTLIDHTGAAVTPEAAVLRSDGAVLYCGRIDDTYVDFGKQRAAPTRRDLRLALDAILAGREPEVDRTTAIGCYIPES